MKHGVIYCRVSSKEQIEGTSLESQEIACREYARNKEIAIAQVFVGRGESAKFADRPELLELLDYCRKHKGELDVLLVWKLDRLARNVTDHFNIKATLLKYGLNVVSVSEPIDSNPEGKLLETILAGFAQFDNDVRAMRTVQGMQRKLQEGIWPWMPPLGYRSVTKATEKKLRPDEPDQPMFGMLQKTWRAFATGAYTKAEIKRLMANWGVVTRKGEPLTDQSLDNLFRNTFYAGILVNPWSGEEYEGKHLAMITRDEFARVQEVISKRNRALPHQRIRPEFPLRGSVRCPQCKKYMTSSFSRGRHARYPYYHCINNRCDNGKSYAAATIHAEFSGFLSVIAPMSERMDELKEVIAQTAEERHIVHRKLADQKRGQASHVDSQIRQLVRMRAQDLITDQEFMAEKTSLLAKQTTLIETSNYRGLSAPELKNHWEQILEPLTNLPYTWNTLKMTQKQRFHQCVLPVGFVAGEIGTAELGLLFMVLRQSDPSTSHEVPLTGENWNRLMQEIKAFAALFDHSMDEQMAA